jgi:hypothetical protein
MIEKVHSVMLDKQRITIRQPSKELGLSFGSGESIVTENLGMKCISIKFVPKLLTFEQKETQLALVKDLLQCADHDANFMNTLITDDKSLVCGYDPVFTVEDSRDSKAKKGTPSMELGESGVDSFL